MFDIIYNNIFFFLEQIGLEFCSYISIYFFEIISSKPIEFFLKYDPQDIIYKFLFYIYIYFRNYIFS
jgi:hypothetical protein